MPARVAGVVLAAGASTRMGEPKALLRWRGRSFVEHVVEAARAVGCSPVVVVEGAVALPEPSGDVVLVHNDAWPRGQLSSLQCGIAALGATVITGVLVLTVDRPHVGYATLEALVEAHRREPDAVWQPMFAAKRGHPLLFPMDVVEAIAALPEAASARTVLNRPEVAARRRFVPVEDSAVLDNLDRPEDLEKLPE